MALVDDPRWFPALVEFSPGIVELGTVLGIIQENEGDRRAIAEALRQQYFTESASRREDPEERHKQQLERAQNVLRGMGPRGLGLFSLTDNTLTEVGLHLLDVDDEKARVEALGSHILRQCRGLLLVQAIRDLQARRERVNKDALHRELERHGVELPRATTYHLTVAAWLREADVLKGRYTVNEEKLEELTGMTTEVVQGWAALTPPQTAFLRTLRRMVETYEEEAIPVKTVVDQTVLEHGRIFAPDQIRGRVTAPLEDAGWIILEGRKDGRGGKSGRLRATSRLLEMDLDLLTDFESTGIPPDLRPKLNTPLEEIRQDLDASDRNVRGIALELLALRIAIDVGLMPLRFRERSAKTGGAEVDLLADGVHLHYSRWSFQCKNTKHVDLNDLAKEVGIATMLKGHVVVMVTTGRFTSAVEVYAQEVMRTTALQVVLVDGPIVERYLEGGGTPLMSYFHESAGEVMRMKRDQVLETEVVGK